MKRLSAELRDGLALEAAFGQLQAATAPPEGERRQHRLTVPHLPTIVAAQEPRAPP
jgi:hypothetical protein